MNFLLDVNSKEGTFLNESKTQNSKLYSTEGLSCLKKQQLINQCPPLPLIYQLDSELFTYLWTSRKSLPLIERTPLLHHQIDDLFKFFKGLYFHRLPAKDLQN
jgi:hypothetical protein